MVCGVEGDLLDDPTLAASIVSTKEQAIDSSKLTDLEQAESANVQATVPFELVAQHFTQYFAAICVLPRLGEAYQFSLNWYQAIGIRSMKEAAKGTDRAHRIANVCDKMRSNVYTEIS